MSSGKLWKVGERTRDLVLYNQLKGNCGDTGKNELEWDLEKQRVREQLE